MTGNAFFADFEDDLNAGSRAPKAAPEVFVERCPKCGGSGRFGTYRSLGPCYSCKGTGKVEYRTSMVQRQKSRASTARTKVNKAEAWAAAHPAEVAWLASARGEFAASLNEALGKYGFLTERQLAAVTRCIERDAERKVERVAREAAAPTTDASRIEEAFQAALAHQVARPKLRLDTFVFSLASASGKNAGAIYVKEGESYLGKISAGRFVASRECSSEASVRILAAVADPAAAATAYGQRVGACSCCGRKLTKGESIDRAIGPICAEKFGW